MKKGNNSCIKKPTRKEDIAGAIAAVKATKSDPSSRPSLKNSARNSSVTFMRRTLPQEVGRGQLLMLVDTSSCGELVSTNSPLFILELIWNLSRPDFVMDEDPRMPILSASG